MERTREIVCTFAVLVKYGSAKNSGSTGVHTSKLPSENEETLTIWNIAMGQWNRTPENEDIFTAPLPPNITFVYCRSEGF